MPLIIGEVEVTNEVSLAPSAVLYDGATVADGDLTVKVNGFYYDLAGTRGKYVGSCANSVTDDATTYVYLDSGANLVLTISGYPAPGTVYIPLARVVASGGFITRIILERAFLNAAVSAGGMVPTSRTITAGAGLTGGGDLSANRTIDVVANADGSITVNANDIQVGILASDAQHGSRGGGTQHAVAVAGVSAGFMSATDKATLDSLSQGNVTLPVRNETGGALLAGRLVAATGWSSPNSMPTVAYADKDTAGLWPAIGILAASIGDGTNGTATVIGSVGGFNTNAYAVNDALVLGNTGQLVRPPPANSPFTGTVQFVGTVTRVHSSQGEISFSIAGPDVVTAPEVFALAGTSGTPGPSNKYVTDGDSRNTNDRTASGLRSATTVVSVSAATAPSIGQVLTALGTTSADWQTPLALTASAPVNVTKAAAAVGVATAAAKADHKHDITTDVGGSWSVGSSAAEGTSTSLARADHVHGVGTPAAPSDVTKAAAAAGSSANPARADHKHDVSTAAAGAVAIGDTASEGTATSLARSDHKHTVSAGTPVDTGTANATGSAATFARSDHVHNTPFSAVQTALGAASGAIDFNGQNLTTVGDINGIHYYPVSATDPVSPAPSDGDRYFNSVLEEFVTYDGTRAKWLTTAQITIQSGASGPTAAGSYYVGMGGVAYTTNVGHPVPKGTLVGLAFSHTNATTPSLEVLVGGSVIATLVSAGAGYTVAWTANADFNEGIMQFRNKLSGGATATNVQITALIKRRI